MENRYTIELVTSTDDIHEVATVFMKAAKQRDTFWEMFARYGPEPPFETLLTVLKSSVENSNHHVLKAVHWPSGQVVGMAQWKAPCYIEIEKVDPFVSSEEVQFDTAKVAGLAAPLQPGIEANEDRAKASGVAMLKESHRQTTNAYITHIRGKKHVSLGRLGVLPEHQRRGVASKLMRWGTDFADAHGIVAYLNGRPEALQLYRNFGYRAVHTTYFKFEDLEVAPVTSMIRLPIPAKT